MINTKKAILAGFLTLAGLLTLHPSPVWAAHLGPCNNQTLPVVVVTAQNGGSQLETNSTVGSNNGIPLGTFTPGTTVSFGIQGKDTGYNNGCSSDGPGYVHDVVYTFSVVVRHPNDGQVIYQSPFPSVFKPTDPGWVWANAGSFPIPTGYTGKLEIEATMTETTNWCSGTLGPINSCTGVSTTTYDLTHIDGSAAWNQPSYTGSVETQAGAETCGESCEPYITIQSTPQPTDLIGISYPFSTASGTPCGSSNTSSGNASTSCSSNQISIMPGTAVSLRAETTPTSNTTSVSAAIALNGTQVWSSKLTPTCPSDAYCTNAWDEWDFPNIDTSGWTQGTYTVTFTDSNGNMARVYIDVGSIPAPSGGIGESFALVNGGPGNSPTGMPTCATTGTFSGTEWDQTPWSISPWPGCANTQGALQVYQGQTVEVKGSTTPSTGTGFANIYFASSTEPNGWNLEPIWPEDPGDFANWGCPTDPYNPEAWDNSCVVSNSSFTNQYWPVDPGTGTYVMGGYPACADTSDEQDNDGDVGDPNAQGWADTDSCGWAVEAHDWWPVTTNWDSLNYNFSTAKLAPGNYEIFMGTYFNCKQNGDMQVCGSNQDWLGGYLSLTVLPNPYTIQGSVGSPQAWQQPCASSGNDQCGGHSITVATNAPISFYALTEDINPSSVILSVTPNNGGNPVLTSDMVSDGPGGWGYPKSGTVNANWPPGFYTVTFTATWPGGWVEQATVYIEVVSLSGKVCDPSGSPCASTPGPSSLTVSPGGQVSFFGYPAPAGASSVTATISTPTCSYQGTMYDEDGNAWIPSDHNCTYPQNPPPDYQLDNVPTDNWTKTSWWCGWYGGYYYFSPENNGWADYYCGISAPLSSDWDNDPSYDQTQSDSESWTSWPSNLRWIYNPVVTIPLTFSGGQWESLNWSITLSPGTYPVSFTATWPGGITASVSGADLVVQSLQLGAASCANANGAIWPADPNNPYPDNGCNRFGDQAQFSIPYTGQVRSATIQFSWTPPYLDGAMTDPAQNGGPFNMTVNQGTLTYNWNVGAYPYCTTMVGLVGPAYPFPCSGAPNRIQWPNFSPLAVTATIIAKDPSGSNAATTFRWTVNGSQRWPVGHNACTPSNCPSATPWAP